jgi:hypothetical protein
LCSFSKATRKHVTAAACAQMEIFAQGVAQNSTKNDSCILLRNYVVPLGIDVFDPEEFALK